MKRTILIILLGAGIGICAIAGLFVFNNTFTNQPAEPEKVRASLRLTRTVEVSNGTFPGIIFADNKFFVSYEINKSIFVKVYDENFTLKDTRQLTHGEGADHQMIFGNGNFYLVDSFYLRKFDPDWQEIKLVSVVENLPSDAGQDVTKAEGLDDMILAFANDSIYLGKGYSGLSQARAGKEKEKPDAPDNLYLRQYSENLELMAEVTLKEMGNVPGSSILQQNDNFLIATADKHWNDSSLIISRFDTSWMFLDERTISAVADANEEFAMGFLEKGGYYFVSYMQITGDIAQPKGEKENLHCDVILKVFDSQWQLVDEKDVSEIAKNVNTGHMGRPHLATAGNKIYVAYDTLQAGIPKIFVKEYEL